MALSTNRTIAHVVPLVDRGIAPQITAGAMVVAGIALTGDRLFAGFLLDRLHPPSVAAIAMAAGGSVAQWPSC